MKIWILSMVLLFTSCHTKNGNSDRTPRINQKLKMEKMDIKFAYTILYVKDVQETMEFYKETFGFEEKMLTPEKDYGEINSGTTTLAFANLELGKSNFKNGFIASELDKKPFGFELAFTTSDVDKVMNTALANGAIMLEEAVTKPWGQTVGYLRDMNGFIIEVCTPIPNQE